MRSLGQLAANRPVFANMALDHLVDMFNDEIEEVCPAIFLVKNALHFPTVYVSCYFKLGDHSS